MLIEAGAALVCHWIQVHDLLNNMCLNESTLNLGKYSHMLSLAFEAQLWTRFRQELRTICEKLLLIQMQSHTRKVEGMCLAEQNV